MSEKKKLILHVGTDKTGTSALQQLFSKNPEKFQRAGVYYPCTGRGTRHQHHMLFAPVCPFSKKAGFESDTPWTELLGALAAEIDERAEQRILLSSELLSQGVEFSALAELKDMFADLRVILYLRRQDHYVMSRYEQAVKTLGACEAFAVKRVAIPDYWKLAREWEAFAGSPEKLVVRPYEMDQFHQSSLYADFLHHALEMLFDDGFALPESRDTNPRFLPEAVEFLRMANRHRRPSGAVSLLWHLTGYSLRDAPVELEPFTRGSQLAPSERVAILDRCRAQNAKVAERYLGRGDGSLFSEYCPGESDGSASRQGLTPEGVLDIAGYLVESLLENPAAARRDTVRDLNLIESVVEEVLSKHPDEKTKWELLADFRARRREKEISFYTTVIERLDDVIASLQNAANQTSVTLHQKDDYIAQQQAALTAQSVDLQHKAEHIARQQDALKQKDDFIAQQQEALAAQSKGLRQKDDFIAHQRDALRQKDDFIAQQQGALVAQSTGLRQKDDYIAQQQDALAAQSDDIRELQERIAEVEGYLSALHGKLAWRAVGSFLKLPEIRVKRE